MIGISLNRFKLHLLLILLLSISFDAECRRIPYLINNELLEQAKRVKVLAIAGPSGVGKSSLVRKILQVSDAFIILRRVTTRPQRSEEDRLKIIPPLV